MLGEGFLTVLNYREEERTFTEGKPKVKGKEGDGRNNGRGVLLAKERQEELSGTAPHPEPPFSSNAGRLIPGRPAILTPDPTLMDYLVDCSLLDHYPDLQVADSGPLPAPRSTTPQPLTSPAIHVPIQPDLAPDQGYLVMGASVNISMDVPELRTNSVLNGMLEKKLEEVYMQHLTDNLARCDSNIRNSLLHGLVPPPQPDRHGPESLVVSLEQSTTSNKTICYLNTSSDGPCSTNFSSPVLRISENQE